MGSRTKLKGTCPKCGTKLIVTAKTDPVSHAWDLFDKSLDRMFASSNRLIDVLFQRKSPTRRK